MLKTLFNVLFSVDEPIKKEEFFKYSFVLILFQVLLVWFYYMKHFSVTRPSMFLLLFILLLIFVEVPFLYIYYMLSSKRVWDISGEKLFSFLINILLMILSIGFLPLFPVIYVFLLLLPSKSERL